MIFFKLDNANETNTHAPILSKKFNCTEEPRPFNSKAFNTLAEADLAHLVFLGHSHKQNIGDFSAAKFATTLTDAFGKKRNKDCIQDIYIIGCETALQKAHEKSLAQSIADLLYAKGFKKVCVHAIASPKQSDAAGMRIRVVTKPGANTFARNVGDVYAYTLTDAQEKRVSAAEKIVADLSAWHTAWQQKDKDKRSQKEIAADKEKLNRYNAADSILLTIGLNEAKSLLTTSDIKAELDKPKNSFYPSTVKPEAAYDEEKEHVIQAIEKHAFYLQIKANAAQDAGDIQRKNMKENHKKTLETLADTIENCSTKVAWQMAIQQCIDNHFSGLTQSLLGTSNTRIFLQELHRGKIPTDPSSNPDDKENEPKKIIPKSSAAAKAQQEQNILLVIAINKIRELSGLLIKEDARKTSLFGISYSFLKTKVIKSRKLTDLADALDVHCQAGKTLSDRDCQALLRSALADKKLTQSIISARTLNLLDNIVAGDPGNGIEKPDPSRNPKTVLPVEPPVIKRWF